MEDLDSEPAPPAKKEKKEEEEDDDDYGGVSQLMILMGVVTSSNVNQVYCCRYIGAVNTGIYHIFINI